MLPRIQYADSGGVQIAYQVAGDGPLDIVFAPDWANNLDVIWDWPLNERLFRRVMNYGRLILFDMRGTGLSDPIQDLPPMEEWMEDVTAVLDAVGSTRAALVGHGHAGQLCMLFAATHPERTASLVTINSYARLARDDDYPWGMPAGAQAAAIEFMTGTWGSGEALGFLMPNWASDPRLLAALARFERSAATPRRAAMRQRLIFEVDVRGVLPAISVPTLVAHSEDHPMIRSGHARYLADHIARGSVPGRPERYAHAVDGRRRGRPAGWDRRVPHRDAHDRDGRPDAHNRRLHGHRALHGAGFGARRSPVA